MPSRTQQLQIKHIGYQGQRDNEQDKSQFVVMRSSDLKSSAPVTLTGPDQTVVPGRPSSNLQQDLRWYLENFLELPTGAYPDLAERVQDSLREWGTACFKALFQQQAYLWFQEARKNGLENLHLKISSDDPRVLAWPWEALYDPEGGTLAHHCRIERQINKNLNDPLPLPENLPKDRINILLVIARPGGDADVGFHALSRPLVELTRDQQLPVHIDVLRPPTFDQLRQQLRARPGFYHIVHFDGHGGYGQTEDSISSDAFKSGAQGRLIFENDEAQAAPVEAEKLSELLAEYRIPIMVLNACQSARIDDQAEDAFASVAAALLKAGIRSVVAMGYNLYVSGAQQFVPAFYCRLLETANVAEATRAGRQAMLAHDQRPCLLGEHPLQDWLVPVLYQQMQGDETVLAQPTTTAPGIGNFTLEEETAPDPLPEQARQLSDDGFIGRQQAVQQLERARLRQPQAAFLIHGMAGVGKTTLAKGFLHWLRDTGGLEQQMVQQVFWFSFDEIRSAEYVINQLIDGIFGTDAQAAPLEQKLAGLIKVFREHPFLLVWDNFESASGLAGTEVRPMLSEDDRGLLKELLAELRGDKTKVLITSRSAEKWLSTGECFRLPLSGLHGEELWQFCNQVLRDLGLTIKRDDEDFLGLIEELDGHPLALRAVLLQLKKKGAGELLADLRKEFALFEGDESSSRILAALGVLDQGLPEEYGPVLQLIGLHRRFVDQDHLEQMLKNAELETAAMPACFALLETAGLLHAFGNNIFQMHPALQSHLEQQHTAEESLQWAFVDFMGSVATNQLALKKLYEQQNFFVLHGGNFHSALDLVQQLDTGQTFARLTFGLATYAQNIRDYTQAEQLFFNLAVHYEKRHYKVEAYAYLQLGEIANDQRDFVTAKKWYKKSLEIFEKNGDESGVASTSQGLGIVAYQLRDFISAEEWHRKALEFFEKQGKKDGIAIALHQLGIIAQEQREFAVAEQWYKKSLAIKEKQNDEHGMAATYNNLGRIAEEQQEFAVAENWCKKGLRIFEKQHNEQYAAISYSSLGRITQAQQKFAAAEQWYKKSLAISEKQGDTYNVAGAYHELGMVAQELQDFATAKQWYMKSLAISEKQGNEHGAASTYAQLGLLAGKMEQRADAGRWFIKAILNFNNNNDQYNKELVMSNYFVNLHSADLETQAMLREKWQKAGLNEIIPTQNLSLDQLDEKIDQLEQLLKQFDQQLNEDN